MTRCQGAEEEKDLAWEPRTPPQTHCYKMVCSATPIKDHLLAEAFGQKLATMFSVRHRFKTGRTSFGL